MGYNIFIYCIIYRSYIYIFVVSPPDLFPGGVSEDEAYIPTYLEAFPPLPEKGSPGERSGEPAGAWSKIRPIKASVITQVLDRHFTNLLPSLPFFFLFG